MTDEDFLKIIKNYPILSIIVVFLILFIIFLLVNRQTIQNLTDAETALLEMETNLLKVPEADRVHYRVVYFYRPTCPACQNFSPIYDSFMELVKGNKTVRNYYNIEKVDISSNQNGATLFKKFNGDTIPFVVITDMNYTSPIVEFDANRDAKTLVDFIDSTLSFPK